jgi:PAS domain S-box-containing protein
MSAPGDALIETQQLRARVAELEGQLTECDTAGRRTDEALRHNQALVRSLLEGMPDPVYVKDRESRILLANPALALVAGKPLDELIGRTDTEYYGDAAVGQVLREHDLAVMTSGESMVVEETVPTPDGLRTFLSSKAPYRNAAGEIAGILGVSRDITRRKQAEETVRHRNAILDGVNRIFSRALSCDTDEELGRTCLRIAEEATQSRFGFIADVGPEGRVDDMAISDPGWEECRITLPTGHAGQSPGFPIRGLYGRVLLDGKGFYTNDPSTHPDFAGPPEGHPQLTAFLAVPFVYAGKTLGMMAVANRDGGYRPEDLETLEALAGAIVQALMRQRAEQAARAAEERLRQMQKLESLGLMAAGVAHDFNNILVGVIGNASLVQEILPPENPAAELLEAVVCAGQRAARLTRQMLAYSGKGRLISERISLSDLAAEACGLAGASISKKINLRLAPGHDVPLVEADRGQTEQVLLNLVLNAAEAIGCGEGAISVSTGVQDVDARYVRAHPEAADLPFGEYVRLEVRDTGCGMDGATRAKIFDPFFSTKFAGRGLGLAAVAGIVRSHKGAILVSSQPGKGSCFTVLFPSAGRAAAPGPAAVAGGVHGTGTILVVDDEQVVRSMARKTLERCGYCVLVAESGLEAIDVVKRHPGEIVAVLLDLAMPGLGGEETLPQIRRLRPAAKVIVSSGYTEDEATRMLERQRVAGFIQKPYTATGLAEKIAAALA